MTRPHSRSQFVPDLFKKCRVSSSPQGWTPFSTKIRQTSFKSCVQFQLALLHQGDIVNSRLPPPALPSNSGEHAVPFRLNMAAIGVGGGWIERLQTARIASDNAAW
jgi:hypothetical protein